MERLKKYKTFESQAIGNDVNYEDKIDAAMQSLLKKKQLVSMLRDTITHVCDDIEKSLPKDIEGFMLDLYHYDDEIYSSVDEIKEKMIDGLPNLKDMIEDVESEFNKIQNYMKLKK